MSDPDEARPFRPPASELPRAALEAVAMGVVLAIVGRVAYPEDPGLLGPRLDPYLVLVLVQALRYPRLGGLLATLGLLGVRAAALWVDAGSWGALSYATRDLLGDAGLALLFVALVAGEVGSRVERALRRSRARREELEREAAQLRRRASMLALAREELEDRLDAQPVTLASFYRAAQRLQAEDPAAIEGVVLDLAGELVEAERLSLWRVEGGRARLLMARGAEPEVPPGPRSLSGLEARAVELGAVHLLADLDPEDHPDSDHPEPMAVVAIRTRGKASRLLRVDALPFARQTKGTRTLLGLLAELAGLTLTTAERVRALRARGEAAAGGDDGLVEAIAAALGEGGAASLLLVSAQLSPREARAEVGLVDAVAAAARGAAPASARVVALASGEVGVALPTGDGVTAQLVRRKVEEDLAVLLEAGQALVVGVGEAAAQAGDERGPRALLRSARGALAQDLRRVRLQAPAPVWNARLGEDSA